MKTTALEIKYYRQKTNDTKRQFIRQKNYTNKLLKKEKRKYFSNLNLANFTDNKKFWNTVKPLFSNKEYGSQRITLIEANKVITDDA